MTESVACSYSNGYRRAWTVSPITNTWPACSPTSTHPDDGYGVGVVRLSNAQTAPTWLRLVMFGTGASGATFDVRVVGLSPVPVYPPQPAEMAIVSPTPVLYVPIVLVQFTATLSGAVGVDGTMVTSAENFADTVSAPAIGTAGVDCQPSSPADGIPAHYLVDTKGCEYAFIYINVGTATAGNALVAWV